MDGIIFFGWPCCSFLPPYSQNFQQPHLHGFKEIRSPFARLVPC